ncbi:MULTISPECIES: hypothetical protein [unclassified Deinococcus]|jgi:hypothetical protein|uniref:hypothetical protein n=1 Tax=unclassified Deinococcus TaxID=2623546 RepID=UPI001C302680|nr:MULTISPECIES: hypothetical protein [unclassified Deinococcus]MDK2014735.1 hypothetical protein [Deinococcus sp. 43]
MPYNPSSLKNLEGNYIKLESGVTSEVHRVRAAQDVQEWFKAMTAEQRGDLLSHVMSGQTLRDHQPTAPAAPAPDADQLRDLEVGTSLRVASTTLPSRLKNEMRWNAARYEALEAVLRGTQTVTLHRTNGKLVWRNDSGVTMRRETVERLLKENILIKADLK